MTPKEIAYFKETEVEALIRALSSALVQESIIIKLFLLTGMSGVV